MPPMCQCSQSPKENAGFPRSAATDFYGLPTVGTGYVLGTKL